MPNHSSRPTLPDWLLVVILVIVFVAVYLAIGVLLP